MTERLHDRLFALCGILFVVLELGGAFLAMATGKTHSLTVGSSTSGIARAIAHPVGTGTWIGAYMELLSVGFFLAFAVWAAAKLGGGLLGSVARAAAVTNAGAGLVALAIGDTISYEAGHGLGLGVARTLVTLNEAVYVATWFAVASLLACLGLLALSSRRRIVGWSALGIAAYTLVLTPLSFDGAGQFSQIMWLLWAAGTSIALVRAPGREPAPALASSGV